MIRCFLYGASIALKPASEAARQDDPAPKHHDGVKQWVYPHSLTGRTSLLVHAAYREGDVSSAALAPQSNGGLQAAVGLPLVSQGLYRFP